MNPIKPLPLQEGDIIGICAPSGIVDQEELEGAKRIIEDRGYRVLIGEHVFKNERFFASSDENRALDFQSFLDNESVRAIYCARGGYGAGKIIDHLDFSGIVKKPKWIIGFSDITVIQLRLIKEGIISIHGPVARQLNSDKMKHSTDSLFDLLRSGNTEISWDSGKDLNLELSGTILGGNLSMLVNSIGTSTDFDIHERILFIEDVGEHIYRIDRMLNQMKRAGKFDQLKAVLIGEFTNVSETNPPYGISVYEMISEYFTHYEYPVIMNFPVGHGQKNFPVLQNGNANISIKSGVVNMKMD